MWELLLPNLVQEPFKRSPRVLAVCSPIRAADVSASTPNIMSDVDNVNGNPITRRCSTTQKNVKLLHHEIFAARLLGLRVALPTYLGQKLGEKMASVATNIKLKPAVAVRRKFIWCTGNFQAQHRSSYDVMKAACLLRGSKWKIINDHAQWAVLQSGAKTKDDCMTIDALNTIHQCVQSTASVDIARCPSRQVAAGRKQRLVHSTSDSPMLLTRPAQDDAANTTTRVS